MGKSSKIKKGIRDAQITRAFFDKKTAGDTPTPENNSHANSPTPDNNLPLSMGNHKSGLVGRKDKALVPASPDPATEATKPTLEKAHPDDKATAPCPISYKDTYIPQSSLDALLREGKKIGASIKSQAKIASDHFSASLGHPKPTDSRPTTRKDRASTPISRRAAANGEASSAGLPSSPTASASASRLSKHPPGYEFLDDAADAASLSRAAAALVKMAGNPDALAAHLNVKIPPAKRPAAAKPLSEAAQRGLPVPGAPGRGAPPIGARSSTAARKQRPPFKAPTSWAELQPIACTCPDDCSWKCPECVHMQHNHFQLVERPLKGAKDGGKGDEKDQGKLPGFKEKVLANPEACITMFATITNGWIVDEKDEITKGYVRQLGGYLKYAYPPRKINTIETLCKRKKCKNDAVLQVLNENIRAGKEAGVVSGHAITFSKDIIVWVNFMLLADHSFVKKINPFIIGKCALQWEGIWFHDENGDLDKLYLDVAYALLKGMYYSRIEVWPWGEETQADEVFFDLTEKALVGVFVDMYRKRTGGVGRRESTLLHWEQGKLSRARVAKIVAEMSEGALEVEEEGAADGTAADADFAAAASASIAAYAAATAAAAEVAAVIASRGDDGGDGGGGPTSA